MPWPTGPVQVGVHGENAALHAMVDNSQRVGQGATGIRALPMGSLMEMLLGHRSGGGVNTNAEFDAGVLGLSPAAAVAGNYSLGGTATGTAAGTLTDTNQSWIATGSGIWANYGVFALSNGQFDVIASNTATVLTLKSNWVATPSGTTRYYILALADQNQGATVSYTAGPPGLITDTAKAWKVNQWSGFWVMVGPELRQIVSNTATVLTLDKGFLNGTPAAQLAYGILLPLPVGYNEAQRGAGSSAAGQVQGAINNPLNV